MASTMFPSTPKASPVVDTQSPGKWRHPRLNEIVRRQNATTFDSRNVKKITLNAGAIFATLIAENPLRSFTHSLSAVFGITANVDIVLVILRLLFIVNILAALYPLFRPKDDLSDIPLTPTQRCLLGLDPNSTPPATPGTQYATPPRYRLASGSRAGSPSSRGTSPLANTGSPASRRASYSPTATSPLFQKALANGNRESSRRQSFGSSSMNSSLRESSISAFPSTPSPSANKGNKLGLSNKWLYEKSRRHSAGNSLI